MTIKPRVWTATSLAVLTLAFLATASTAHHTATETDRRIEPGEPPRFLLVVRGDLDVTLTDPLGRVNAMRDTGEYDGIPGCARISGWVDPGSKVEPPPPATAFDVSAATPGLYALRVRAHEPGTVVLDASAMLEKGSECKTSDQMRLRLGERGTFSVAFEPNEKGEACVIRAAHRLLLPPQKKKRA